MKIGIVTNKKIIAEKRKDTDNSGINTKIIGIARSSSIVGNKTSSYQLLETALSAMVIIGMIHQIGDIKMMIGVLMGLLGEEHQFMIGWWGRLKVHDRLGERIGYFPRNQEELWRMHEFPMSSYFVGMLILIRWNRGRLDINR